MSDRQRLADKLGAMHWDDELLATWALERIAELEGALRSIEEVSAIDYHMANVSTEQRREQLRSVNELARAALRRSGR